MEPSFVYSLAIAVLNELGIDISTQRSKGLNEFATQKFDYVITLCIQADEPGPVYFGGTKKIHMGFPNPTVNTENGEEEIAVFRRVRHQMRTQLVEFFSKEIV